MTTDERLMDFFEFIRTECYVRDLAMKPENVVMGYWLNRTKDKNFDIADVVVNEVECEHPPIARLKRNLTDMCCACGEILPKSEY